jgi:4-hydroxybenzoyl-CoA thioesterase
MSKVLSVEYPILFSHCAPAGVVYFPPFFDLLHLAMEDWFTFGLEERVADIIVKKRVGIPTVGTQVDFVGSARFGDLLALELSVARLGRSSIEFAIRGRVGDEEKFRARHRVAMVSLDTFKATAIPDDLRAKMAPYVAEARG